MWVCLCVCVYVCLWVCACMHACVCACVCVRACEYVCACVYFCVRACVRACAYVCICMYATIINVYAPTMTNPDENKEAFYNQLTSVLGGIPHTDKLLLIRDFNARIGRDNDK